MEEMFKEYPDVVNVKIMADMLQIGIALAYKLIQSGAIKSRKVGREYKVSKIAIVQFLLDNGG